MTAPVLVFGSFRLDLANERLSREARDLPLRPKVFAVLRHLAEHPGRLVTRDELLRAAWPKTVVSESVLRGTIRELREVLGDDATAARFVETVPHRGYRFLAAVTTESAGSTARSDRPASIVPTSGRRLIGRDEERARLHAALRRALAGDRQIVFVTGEPGIGKTTLVDAFLGDVRGTDSGEAADQWTTSPMAWPTPPPEPAAGTAEMLIARGQCVEHYGPSEPYLPVLEAFGRLCRQADGARVTHALRRFAPTWLAQLPAVTSDDELAALRRRVHGATHERMLREMADALEALSEAAPLVLVLEDLHWSDPSTVDLLGLVGQRRSAARLLVLATYRPADVVAAAHPLHALKQELDVHRRCDELPLRFFTSGEVDAYLAERFAERALPSALGPVIHGRTEGNPLFMVSVVDDWVRVGALGAVTEPARSADATVAELAADVPASLRQLIEKQLGRLAPDERRVLETASVAGGTFTTAAVAAALDASTHDVEDRCAELAARQQFLRAGDAAIAADGTVSGRYGFLHALHQQVLYERLSPATRVRLHRRIGAWEERAAGDRAGELAAELALHFERGHDPEAAVRHLVQAGRNALRRSAHAEAIRLLGHGLALLATGPDAPERTRHELALQTMLGAALAVTKGYAAPEVQDVYGRAGGSSRRIDASREDFSFLGGLWSFRFLRAEMGAARELAGTLSRLAERAPDPAMRLWAHTVEGVTCATAGDLPAALEHLDAAAALSDAERDAGDRLRIGPQDVKSTCLAYAAWTLWRAGHPDRARAKVHEVVAYARELAHPFTLAFALDFAGAGVHMLLRDVRAVEAYAEELLALARDQSFPYWIGWATVRQGWVQVEDGRVEDGIARIGEGLDAIRTTGAELSLPYVLAQLAEAHAKAGRSEDASMLLDDALARTRSTGEHWYDAELHRLRGEVLLTNRRTPPARAEEAAAHFAEALAVARRQGAKALELRAAIALARLGRRRGDKAAAREALAPIYGWFSEGFDTFDVIAARTLLAEPSAPPQPPTPPRRNPRGRSAG